jgi:hypothetical protein
MRMPSAVRVYRLLRGSRRQSPDEPGQAQPPEVVGHLAGVVVAAEQPGDHGAQALVGEAGRGEQRLAQGAGQGHDSRIAEP